MLAKRWIRLIALAGGVTIGTILCLIWLQDQGLDVIEHRLNAGDAVGALKSVDGFLRSHPNHSRAGRLRARALVALGHPADAVLLFQVVGADRPDDLRAWAQAHMYQRQFSEALKILESLQKIDPLHPDSLELLAVCQYELGMRDAALASARKLASLPGHEATGHLQLALLYRDWGSARLACEHFAQVLQHRPDATELRLSPAEFYLAYGVALLTDGNAAKSLEMFQTSEKIRPTPDAMLMQSEALKVLGDTDRAFSLLEQVVRAYPDHPARRQLDEIRRQRGQSGGTSLAASSPTGPAATADVTPAAAPPSATSSPAGTPADGHERMVQLLAEIKEQTPTQNPFLGTGEAEELKRRLDKLPPDADVAARFDLLNRLGVKQLQLGQTEDAIGRFTECLGLVPKGATDLKERVEYQLGVAYLRLGENENCVHCANGESCLLPIRGGGVHQFKTGSENAIKYLTSVLHRNPKHLSARWLLNLAHMTLGTHPRGVQEWLVIPEKMYASEEVFPRFPSIAQQLRLDRSSLAGGMVVDDLNGDRRLDIVMSQWSTSGELWILLGQPDGTFKDVTDEAGVKGLYGGLNMIQADYDNDGDIDILVLRGGWWGEAGRHPKSLLANDGQARFRDVTFEVGLGDVHYPTQTASWADYDNDGDLDLYVGNEDFPCQLFQNNGRGRFKDVARQAGVMGGGYAKGVVFGDYDNDRYPDLFVSNLAGDNRLFHNRRDGTFAEVASKAGVTAPSRSFPTWFWDFNNDGMLDLYVSAYTSNISIFASDFLGLPHQGETDRLYQGDGQGNFRDVSAEMKVGRVTIPMGSNFGDLDNDGFLDYYLGTGDPNFDTLVPNRMFHNQGGKVFADVSMSAGAAHLQKGHGVAFADVDYDGDQDVLIKMGGAFPGDAFPSAVFQNPGFGNHWLSVKLTGEMSNRQGVGARIRAEIEDGGQTRSIYRWINSGGSFGANPLRAHLGLGKATQVKTLEVYWPTSDSTQKFENVPVDQFLEIVEGRDQWEAVRPAP